MTRSGFAGLVFGLGTIGLVAACGSPSPPPVVDVPPPTTVPVPRASPEPAAVADAGATSSDNPSIAETYLRRWSDKFQCNDYDYGPEGGLQTFWCHRPAGLEIADVARLAGVDIYSTPATSKTDFGHYNPEFVKWLLVKAAPSPHDSAARAATQAAFDAHLKPLAEIFHYTLEKAHAEPECFNREKTAYAALIANKKLPGDYYERWFYFMNPDFCEKAKGRMDQATALNVFSDHGFDGGLNGNVTKTVVGFWLRRAMDGTMDSFAEGLNKLLASYDPEIIAHAYRPPPSSKSIDAMLDKSLAKAQSCKGAGKHANVDVGAAPSGTFSVEVTIPVAPGSRPGGLHSKALLAGGTPQIECIKAAFEGRVAPFDGGTMTFQRSVTIP